MKMPMFIEEIIKTYEDGKISSSFSECEIQDIVFTSLAQTNRFNGITLHPYTTLQHSYAVGNLAGDFAMIYNSFNEQDRNTIRLFGWMHDMGETIVGDMVYPLKKGMFHTQHKEMCKLEDAFLYWLGEEVFNIKDFEKRYKDFYPIIKKADEYIGVLELIGVSMDSNNFFSSELFSGCTLFEEDILQPEFERKFSKLLKEITKNKA